MYVYVYTVRSSNGQESHHTDPNSEMGGGSSSVHL